MASSRQYKVKSRNFGWHQISSLRTNAVYVCSSPPVLCCLNNSKDAAFVFQSEPFVLASFFGKATPYLRGITEMWSFPRIQCNRNQIEIDLCRIVWKSFNRFYAIGYAIRTLALCRWTKSSAYVMRHRNPQANKGELLKGVVESACVKANTLASMDKWAASL